MDYVAPVDRQTYEAEQLARDEKFVYCKCSIDDVQQYVSVLRRHIDHLLPVLCLGVRNGREVDLWRIVLRGSRCYQRAVRLAERRQYGRTSGFPLLERIGRDNWRLPTQSSCLGVELSPRSHRPDVWVGSFDALPDTWLGQFGVVFSNAFDHAYEPVSTAAHWWGAVRIGGFLVLDSPHDQVGDRVGPVGKLELLDVLKLFPGQLLFYRYRGSSVGYSTFILRKTEEG